MRERLPYITKLQSFAIFLVVLGHCRLHHSLNENPAVVMWVQRFIYSFHMPLFMFIAGFLFMHTNLDRRINYGRFIFGKFKRLILPYLVLSTAGFLLKNLFSEFAVRGISFDISNYFNGLIYPSQNPVLLYWFLPTLFIIFLISPLLKNLIGKKGINSAIFLVLVLLYLFRPVRIKLLNLEGVGVYLVFFYLGGLFSYYEKNIKNIVNHYGFVILMFLALMVFFEVNDSRDARILKLLTAMTGIIFAFSMSYFLVGKKNAFRYIEGYSYQIFLLSWFSQLFFRTLFQMKLINDYYVCLATMFLGGYYLPVIAAKLIGKSNKGIKLVFGMKG